jgi:hypothetical protein
VLARAKATGDDLEDALFDAIGPEGALAPTLMLLDGELTWLEVPDADASALPGRPHAERRLYGQAWIRALFEPSQTVGSPVPTYLPAAAAEHLPLFRRFTARIIADVVPQQDETEECPVALRVAALARVITRGGGT